MQGPAAVWMESGLRLAYAVGGMRRYGFGRYFDERGSDISRLATPLGTVVSSAQAALNLARRPPATRDRAMNSPIVARDAVASPAKNSVFSIGLANASCAPSPPTFA